MCLYQKGLFWQFSVNLLSVTSETYTRYSLNTYAEVVLSFFFILLMAVDHKTTLMLQEAQSFQIYVIHQTKVYHSLASCFRFPSRLLDPQRPSLFLFALLPYYLYS